MSDRVEQTLFWQIVAFLPLLLILMLGVFPVSRIFKRIGYSPWLAFFILIPVLNVILLYVVAFGKWKIDAPRG
ncbi:MAG: hypothetical protein M3N41_10205 [Acidobacteriota bacterium]|nr:hypothetical protein [Acidobacteriota bacterium]